MSRFSPEFGLVLVFSLGGPRTLSHTGTSCRFERKERRGVGGLNRERKG